MMGAISQVRSFKLLSSSNQQKLLAMSTSRNGELKKFFALEYTYVPGIVEKRAPFRAKHLELLEDLKKNGKLIGAGPYSPPTGAFFLFKDISSVAAEEFVKADPYVIAGLVTNHRILEWTKVIGIGSL